MTISVLIAHTGGSKPLLVTLVDKTGTIQPEHYHIEPNTNKHLTVWEGRHVVLSEEVPSYLQYPALEDGKNG